MSRSSKIIYLSILITAMASTLVGSHAADEQVRRSTRYGSVIGLRADKISEYKKLHAAIWPAVAKAVKESNIRNYSIYLRKLPDGKHYLFSYFEYVGDDFQADMERLAANSEVKRWWSVTDACQEPLADRGKGEWWGAMEEVFHQD
jgi:L-rhamnose mutarotase